MNTAKMVQELAAPDREGCTNWLYCDSRGFPTTGIGNLVASADAAVLLPWHHLGSGLDATDEDKRAGWKTVVDAFIKGRSATAYRSMTTLRLTAEYVYQLAATRIEREFVPGIRRLCHDFDEWPEPAQMAIVDMAYNLGLHGLSHFVNFLGACQARDWATAARECHRATCRESRNEWTKRMFEDAEAMKGPQS